MIGLVLMLGAPILLPVGLGVWAYRASLAYDAINRWLRIFAIVAAPAATATIWSMFNTLRGPLWDRPLVIPAYVIAMIVGCVAVGIGCAYVTRVWTWVGWIISIAVVLALILLSTLLGFALAMTQNGFA